MRGCYTLALPLMSALARYLGVGPCREAALKPAALQPCAKAEPKHDIDKSREREGVTPSHLTLLHLTLVQHLPPLPSYLPIPLTFA